MVRTPVRVAISLAAGALLASCHPPATAILVQLDTDLTWGAGQQVQSMAVNVWTGGQLSGRPSEGLRQTRCFTLAAGDAGPGTFALPGSLVVQPLPGAAHPVTVEAVAYRQPGCPQDAASELLATRAIVTFRDQVTEELDLYLAGRCLLEASSCQPDQSCGRQGCVSTVRQTLPNYAPDAALADSAPVPDAPAVEASSPDAAPDATTDAVMDAAPDAVTDAAADAAVDVAMDAAVDAAAESATDAVADAAKPPDAPFDNMDDTVADAETDGGLSAADAPSDAPSDAPLDVPPDVPPPPPNPPRPLSPLSTSRVTSARPTLRWRLPLSLEGAQVTLCRDRAMTSGCLLLFVAAGTSAVPAAALAPGWWFWSLQGTVGGALVTESSPVWQFQVPAAPVPGVDVSRGSVLDVNGDGFGDLAVGAPGASSVSLYHGSAAGLASGPPSEQIAYGTGYSGGIVRGVGDVNGDGFGDLVVAVFGTRSALVYHGGPAGLAPTPTTTLGDPLFVSYGTGLAALGDTNGDGYADVAVSGGTVTGESQVHIYLGSPDGLSTMPAQDVTVPDPATESDVQSAGDLNCDGLADLAVGNAGYNGGAGRVYVFQQLAGGAGFSPIPTIFTGSDATGLFGGWLTAQGDLDNDGCNDLVVGAPRESFAQGVARVYFGAAGGLPAVESQALPGPVGNEFSSGGGVTDLNGDGLDDLVLGSHYDARTLLYVGTPSRTLVRNLASPLCPDGDGLSFAYFTSHADYDGDGVADLASGASQAGAGAGRVYVFSASHGASFVAAPIYQPMGPGAATAQFGASVD